MKAFNQLTRREFVKRTVAGISGCLGLTCCNHRGRRKSKKANYQIGCYTRAFSKYDYLTAFDAIAEAGFKYVGVMSSKDGYIVTKETPVKEAEKVGREAKVRGLTVISMFGSNIGVIETLQTGIEGVKKIIDNCAALECKNMLLCGHWDERYQDDYYKAVSMNLDYAQANGISMNLKSHGPYNDTGPELRAIVEKINHPALNVWYDPGNTYWYSEGRLDPVEDAATLKGLIKGMCVKDFLPPKQDNITPGTGQVDFPALFEVLKEGGFTSGPLVIECLTQEGLSQTIQEARGAKRMLEQFNG